jgi:hypothetical protein
VKVAVCPPPTLTALGAVTIVGAVAATGGVVDVPPPPQADSHATITAATRMRNKCFIVSSPLGSSEGHGPNRPWRKDPVTKIL